MSKFVFLLATCSHIVKIAAIAQFVRTNFLVPKVIEKVDLLHLKSEISMSLEFVSRVDNPDPASIGSESSWFLAHTRPRLETVALQNLQQQGFDVYLPLYKRLKKIDASMHVVFEPMFSRYVFFRTTCDAQSIAPVRSTRGVAQIVSFGSEFATIRSDMLDAIRKIEQARNVADVTELSSLRPGSLVRFCNSALSGLEGVVKSVSSYRVAVLFEVMGRQQLIRVGHDQLEAA